MGRGAGSWGWGLQASLGPNQRHCHLSLGRCWSGSHHGVSPVRMTAWELRLPDSPAHGSVSISPTENWKGPCFHQPHRKPKMSPLCPVVCGKADTPEEVCGPGSRGLGDPWGLICKKGAHPPWPLSSISCLIPWEAGTSRPLQLVYVNRENAFTKLCSFPVQIVFCSNPKRVF